ncbi:geranylgeranyl reductase family protein [Microvirga sp. STR05]|uniref:Geranylgeranyl reductase family protein n=1 Tax=Hymenobacter duratus TaxID=2771356 RepID=A0ABR8JLU7_9BACT|nr:geranylgeranyl reductase family protein [Hymenobacter duratus]MBD2715509.1 geranylgeranyl reductase family protein [Hymenobacter duratus]MBR7950417.1 geranylgeranyl reductase family protein [Microvirga sp. STR05]
MLETDICILGAGPGGATAALHLANAGQPCLLLDRATFPRDKVCGDALSGKVLVELKRIDATLPARLQALPTQIPSWGIDFYAPNGRRLTVPFKYSYNPATDPAAGHISKRIDFDNFLIGEVRQRTEIDFREGTDVAQPEQQPDGRWLLKTADGTPVALAQLLLVANGAQSGFARQIAGHALEPAHHCAGLRAYYRGVRGLHPDNFIELHFIKDFLPGYLWVFPLPNGEANVGVGMLTEAVSKKRVNLRERLAEILATHPALKDRFAEAERLGPVRGFGLPLGSKRRALSGRNYLLLGDAASLIDPFTGEGISHAMVSGRHAADWAGRALAARNFAPAFLRGYDAAVYNRLGQELRLSRAMQKLLDYPWLFNFVANRAARNPTLAETLSMMFLDLDMRARVRQPSFYLKLLFGRK